MSEACLPNVSRLLIDTENNRILVKLKCDVNGVGQMIDTTLDNLAKVEEVIEGFPAYVEANEL